jgi:enterochelin esterase-like enzyme
MLVKPSKQNLIIWLIFIFVCSLSACGGNESIPGTATLSIEKPIGVSTDIAPTNKPESNSDQPTLSPIPISQDCEVQTGSLEPFLITKDEVELSGSIYKPPCYESDPDQRYPSLYLFHGATATDQQWLDLGIPDAADRLIANSLIQPLIIVMPLELTWVALPDNPFGDYLVKELVPWVDKNYRTLPDSEFRAIGGLSRGGNWAVRIGLLHWGMFGSIGAHSTPLFFGDLNRVQGWIEVIPSSRVPEIYLDIGQDDNNFEAAQKFREKLAELDVPHAWNIEPGLHDEVYWSSHVDDYLLWYSSRWDNQNR